MQLLARLVRSTAISPDGASTKRRPSLVGRNLKSAHQFLHVLGTNQLPCMQACGKSGRRQAFSSRSGLARVGVGFAFASLVEKSQKDTRCAVRNWSVDPVGGTCTHL